MLKAGTLLYAIFISVIIFLLTTLMILFLYLNSKSFMGILAREKVMDHVSSGIYLLTENNQLVNDSEEKKINVFEDESQVIFIKKNRWGAFQTIISTSYWKNDTLQEIALVGCQLPENLQQAVFLTHLNEGLLNVAGESQIKGAMKIPGGRIKKGFVMGKKPPSMDAFDGKIEKSEKQLPAIDEHIKTIPHLKTKEVENFIEKPWSRSEKYMQNSFGKPTIVFQERSSFSTDGVDLIGNFILKSNEAITISKNSFIEDVIVIAPYVKIAKGFEGNLQVFATDSVTIEKDCFLKYPSFISVLSENKSNLSIEEDVTIIGYVVMQNSHFDLKSSRVQVKENCNIYGLIYSTNYVELNSNVSGSVFTNKFFYETKTGSIYENYLIDCKISLNELPEHFVAPLFFNDKEKYEIVKWLD